MRRQGGKSVRLVSALQQTQPCGLEQVTKLSQYPVLSHKMNVVLIGPILKYGERYKGRVVLTTVLCASVGHY